MVADRNADSPARDAVLPASERVSTDPARASARIPRRNALSAPLSFEQERLWFIEELEGDAVHHNDGFILLLDGELDTEALARSIVSLVRRHEILRTAFRRDGDQVRQVVTDVEAAAPAVADLPGATLDPADSRLVAAARAEMAAPLDLAAGRPLRTKLLRLGPREHVLVLTVHHLVFDLWSFGVLGRELGSYYAAYLAGDGEPALPEPAIHYGDYADWQRSRLSAERLDGALRDRTRALADAPPVSSFPTERARPAVQRFRGAAEWFHLDRELTDRLRSWSHANGATLYMSLLAAFKTLLARHSDQRDILVASPIANRNPRELEDLLGCFVNMIVIRTDLSGEPGFLDVVKRVRASCLDAYTHRELPFDRLVAALHPARTRSHQPVVQVAFVLQNLPVEPLELPGLTARFHELDTGRARMDVSVRITEGADGLTGELEYDTDLFPAERMRGVAAQFDTLLRAVLADPGRCVWDQPIVGAADTERILRDWNDTKTEFPGEALIHRHFEAQAVRTPDAVAVVAGPERITYRRLNERANRLARFIRRAGVATEATVAVFLPRSVMEVVAILAVMKAGACYVPIDPATPRARRDEVLAQTAPALVLSAGDLSDEVWAPGRRVVDVDLDWDRIAGEDAHDLDAGARPGNLAYTLFTSGTTGRPKGVLLSHRGFVNRMLWGQLNHPLDTRDRVLRKAACTFDVSLDELFRALFNGAASVLMPQVKGFDPHRIAQTVEEHAVTDADFSPTALRELLCTVDPGRLASLRRIVSGVEELSPETQQLIFKSLDVELFNLYGPTEVSVSATSWRCDPHDDRGHVPIGRPMANVRCYVLDARLQLTPPGSTGELYIGGDGLARGYLGRPGLTAERFVPDLFSGVPGARLYRTGDLVRLGHDGALEFVGRADSQVNLRGYRVEPAEIENTLREHPDVLDAAIVLDRRGTPQARLVAYLITGRAVTAKQLREYLRDRLPDYMVPTAFVRLDALPLTAHGKLDLAALPAPDEPVDGERGGGDPPRDGTERTLAAIWQEVLGRDAVGIHDDFFDLGGDSLTATRILARAGAELGVVVSVAAIFDAPTIAELAAHIARVGH